jgi:hypothetical protein
MGATEVASALGALQSQVEFMEAKMSALADENKKLKDANETLVTRRMLYPKDEQASPTFGFNFRCLVLFWFSAGTFSFVLVLAFQFWFCFGIF